MNKKILIPVTVPQGDYCVNHKDNAICQYFDNEGGHPTCDLDQAFDGFDSLEYDKDGNVPKLSNCLECGDE